MLTFIKKLCPAGLLAPQSILLAAVIALLFTLFTSWNYNRQLSQTTENTINHYGQSIVTLAADQAAFTGFEKDPISLQAVTRNIAEKSAVITVIAYDIENTILAQTSLNEDKPLTHFTAPVTISNHIAGSITIGIDTEQLIGKSNQLGLLLTTLLLIATIIICYRKCLKQHDTPIKKEINNTLSPNDVDTMTHSLQNNEAYQKTILIIQLTNVNEIYQQLNAESRKQQLDSLEEIIKPVLSLYNGNIVTITNDSIILDFNKPSKDNTFNALCAGHLIININQKQPKSFITINAIVQENHQDQSLNNALKQGQQNSSIKLEPNQLAIQNILVDEFDLGKRLAVEEDEVRSHIKIVKAFKGNYANLIDNQLSNLSNALYPLEKA